MLELLGLLIGAIGFFIAIYQVQDSKRVMRIMGELSAIEAAVSIELSRGDARDMTTLERLYDETQARIAQLGAGDVVRLLLNTRSPGDGGKQL